MHTFHEFVVGGVLMAPIVRCAAITLLLVILIRPLMHRAGFPRLFARPSVAELSLYLTMFGLITLFS